MVIEFGDFLPAVAHLAAEDGGMASVGEHGVRIVVDHVALAAPQQHDGHRGEQEDPRGGLQALRPALDGAERRSAPFKRSNESGHLTRPLEEAQGVCVLRVAGFESLHGD
jgi:hypothetical protein